MAESDKSLIHHGVNKLGKKYLGIGPCGQTHYWPFWHFPINHFALKISKFRLKKVLTKVFLKTLYFSILLSRQTSILPTDD